MAKGKIALAELVQELRRELGDAVLEGSGQSIRFAVQEIKLEAQVAVEKTGKAEGGFKLWVIDALLAGEIKASAVQKVTVTLKPTLKGVDGEDEDLYVSE